MKRLEDRPWWPELVSLKDTLSLRELAERFGAAPAAIANALRRNNLERAPAPPGPRAYRDPAWRAAADAVIAETPAPAPAAKASPKSAKADKAPVKPSKAAKPAKAAKVAKAPAPPAVKVEPEPVVAKPAVVTPAAVKPAVATPAVVTPAVVAPAAVKPAAVKEAVVKEIEKAAPAPAVAPAPVAVVVATPSVKQVRGYRAMINGEGYVIVAGNVAEAAAVACASGQGDVVSIELLGLALSL